ncbi:hypothetical protein IEN85_07810 [Pelagicoccus sp. NFK12]|uniref:Uncharacterized protein n=1 Tax=Pelagicoccus enzymogenes TaxID=2773457 RepID=A0A927IET7_9BACT|nr:hypothetical protein [Pelagicoccus enzymogenes]MBD5779397.1 hypothetical protein [Pelagicoccus enzymogenes]MDQ8200578.1 hypothetical protein [Pelagicoccus enzymogenes]
MAWRIDKYVVRGLIQNIVPGRVVGTVWLKGLNQPIELNLKGNCYRDLAGARLEFRNPKPIEGDYSGFDIFQEGTVGDMTASKKVKTPPDLEDLEETTELPPAFKLANCLYLEWFSESNGRVLIETLDFTWKVSLPKWTLSADAERDQQEANKQAMFNFMDELSRALDPAEQREEPMEEDMDEFQWEAFLQKSDARSDMLLELFEKYENAPDCEEIIAQAMGWEIDSMEVTEEFFEDWEVDQNGEGSDSDFEYLPNHPLIVSMMEITSKLYDESESRKLLSEDTSNPWNQLIWHGQMTVSKLIAALEQVSEGVETEPGFVVAALKRALHLLHLTIATMEACISVKPEEHKWTAEIRKELFTLRESIIDLMHNYRQL